MTGLLVRAIGRAGSGGRGLRVVEAGRLCAWVDEVPAAMDRAALLEHHRVVEGLGECLPVRFGTIVEGEAALAEMLAGREEELLGRLERVAGNRELAVTGLWRAALQGEDESTGGPGRRYMEARRARARREERARALAEEVARAVGVAEEDARHVVPVGGADGGPDGGGGTVAFSSALLVAAAAAAATKAAIEGLELAEVRLLVHGPWPPYTFAG